MGNLIELSKKIVGMDQKDAKNYLKSKNYCLRPIKINGKQRCISNECNCNRVNVVIQDDVISEISHIG